MAASVIMITSLCGIAAAAGDDLLRVDGSIVKWPSPATGGTTVVTYAVLTASYALPRDGATLSPDNCSAMSAFGDVITGSPGVTIESARRELRAALTSWESVANIRFVDVGDSRHADIVVGAAVSARGRAFANLSYRGRHSANPDTQALGAVGQPRPVRPLTAVAARQSALIEQAYICLNPKVPWKIGFDGNLEIYDLRHAFLHEIGHSIGLDHPGSSGAIMGYRYDERVKELQASDVDAARSLYGPSESENIASPAASAEYEPGAQTERLHPRKSMPTSQSSEGLWPARTSR